MNDEYLVRVMTRVKLPGFQSRHVNGTSVKVRTTDTFGAVIHKVCNSFVFYEIKKVSVRIGGIPYTVSPDRNKTVLGSCVGRHLSTKEVPELIYLLNFFIPEACFSPTPPPSPTHHTSSAVVAVAG
ncbi:5551_t:CDS:2, partial [Paraglomus occultum]